MKQKLIAIFCFSILLCCNDSKSKNTTNNKTPQKLVLNTHTISNGDLKVTIKTKGAELASILVDDKEYLWQGDPEYWNRQSPILFPIVGRLKDNEYTYKNETYKMKQHGFARDYDFKVVKKNSHSLVFEQTATAQTKTVFPFDYVLQIKYTIEGKTLDVDYVLKNPSFTEDLYFTIGAHPAFNCPFETGQKRSDYQLVFDTDAMPKSQDKTGGLYIDQWTQHFKVPGVLDLPDTIFDDGSLTFNPNPFSKVTFVNKQTKKQYLSVAFKDFPYLGIWSSKSNSPFICIEPWYGTADHIDHNKDYTKKKGVLKLEPEKTFKSRYTIEIL